MKHLKKFESFNQFIDEGLLSDTIDKVKRYSINSDLIQTDSNKQNRNWMKSVLSKIDTNKVKHMQVFGKKKTKTDFSVDEYLKTAEKLDNFNGRLFIEGDTIYYKPISHK